MDNELELCWGYNSKLDSLLLLYQHGADMK